MILYFIICFFASCNEVVPANPSAFDLCEKEKRGDVCYGIAYLAVENGKIIDESHYLKWATLGCDNNDPQACGELSKFWDNGKEKAKDEEKSFMYLKKGCELFSKTDFTQNDENSRRNKLAILDNCDMLSGIYYSNEKSSFFDIEKAIELNILLCKEKESSYNCHFAYSRLKKQGKESEALKWLMFGCVEKHEFYSCLTFLDIIDSGKKEEKADLFYNMLEMTKTDNDLWLYSFARAIWVLKKDSKGTTEKIKEFLKIRKIQLKKMENDEFFKEYMETEEFKKLREEFKDKFE